MIASPALTRVLAGAALVWLAAAAPLPAQISAMSGAEEPVLLGVPGVHDPRLTYLTYQPLVEHLTTHTGRRFSLVVGTTQSDTVAALCAEQLSLAYLEPLALLRARELCGARPVVRAVHGEQGGLVSCLLVRQDSAYRTIGDLRGATIAFGTPLSTSCHLVPRALLASAGISPNEVDCQYHHHHEQAARAVLLGEADACGMGATMARLYASRGLRSIACSDPMPGSALVVAPNAPAELTQALTWVLVGLPQKYRAVARQMEVWDEELQGGFCPVEEGDYVAVREMAVAVLGPDGASAPEDAARCPPGGP